MNFTPNVKKLVIHKTSLDAIPPGGTIADGVKFLTEPGRLAKGMREASGWVKEAIDAVRQAGEQNPWKNASDEDIAGEILRRIEERKTEKEEKKGRKMTINLNIKIKVGPRTPTQVEVCGPPLNEKFIKLPNGKMVSGQYMASFLEKAALDEMRRLSE